MLFTSNPNPPRPGGREVDRVGSDRIILWVILRQQKKVAESTTLTCARCWGVFGGGVILLTCHSSDSCLIARRTAAIFTWNIPHSSHLPSASLICFDE